MEGKTLYTNAYCVVVLSTPILDTTVALKTAESPDLVPQCLPPRSILFSGILHNLCDCDHGFYQGTK